MNMPGTHITIGDELQVDHPIPTADMQKIFSDKLSYLRNYQSDYLAWLDEMKANWAEPSENLLNTLKAWWEPLLAMAPSLRQGIGAACLLRAGDLDILIDFPNGEVRAFNNEPYGFRFEIDRRLVETVVAQNAVDWSDKLFLSCRFSAWRSGSYNEYIYNFFKSLSVERMQRTEAEAVKKFAPATPSDEITIGDYIVERYCPHRKADLSVFGECSGTELVCTLHGWKFDLETGECLTAQDRKLIVRRAQ
jgi:UDP-MurNAc hydroxylase